MSENVEMNVSDANANANANADAGVKHVNVDVDTLKNLKSILEISTGRGCYRANELSSVGSVYDKLTQYLKDM